LASIDDRVI